MCNSLAFAAWLCFFRVARVKQKFMAHFFSLKKVCTKHASGSCGKTLMGNSDEANAKISLVRVFQNKVKIVFNEGFGKLR